MSLSFQILPACAAASAGEVLGGAYIGPARPAFAAAWPEQALVAPLPGAGEDAVREIWCARGEVRGGVSEGIVWQRRGDVLFGAIEVDEAAFPAGPGQTPLQAASDEAYARIFRLLEDQRLPHLWRIWNYMADINGSSHGLERYRQFNIGRQDAFLSAQRRVRGQVPAACALGLAAGPLSVAFLAGACPVVPIENPRQVSAYDYPDDYGPRSPTFSRGALVFLPDQTLMFISGTASIVGHRSVHAGDVLGQCRESMANVAAVLEQARRMGAPANLGLEDLAYRVYLRHAEDHGPVRGALLHLIGTAPAVFVQADVCREDLLLEIEAVALRPAEEAS